MRDRRHSLQQHRLNVWVSLVLAAFILYNPFAALCSSHGPVEVHTLQRNRASVGASELQHFSPVQHDTKLADLDLERKREQLAVPAETSVARGFEREEEVPQSDIVPSVWSRPPPSK